MNTRALAAVVPVAILLAGCAAKKEEPPAEPPKPAVDIAAEEQAIRSRSAEWMNFSSAKDTASIVKVYSPDAITAYDGDVQRGVAEIQAGVENGQKENPDSVVSWTTTGVRVAASGDLAVETGNITRDRDGDAGKEPATSGVYVTVWEKVDGAWRVIADAGTENEKKD